MQERCIYYKNGISPTLTATKSNEILIEDGRRLIPIECERLQGYPDNWTIGNDSQRYKCLGNAVTINVIEAIVKEMVKKYGG